MSDPVTYTVNLGLARPPANRFNWSELVNNNFTMIDAAISTFFIVQQFTGPWTNSTPYVAGDTVLDTVGGGLWRANSAHNSSSAPTTFVQEKIANPALWSAYSSSGVGRGIWTANTAYQQGDFAVSGNQYAVAIVSHVSTNSFANDVASGYWAILVDFSLVGTQPLPILGGIGDANKFAVSNPQGTGWTAYDGPNALLRLGGTSIGLGVFLATDNAGAQSSIGGGPAGQAVFQSITLSNVQDAIGAGAFGRQMLATATSAEANALLGIASGPILAGSMVVDLSLPAGYIEADGSAVSRTTYSALFLKYGVTFGVGDGVTTFNLPTVPTIVAYAIDGTPVALKTYIRV